MNVEETTTDSPVTDQSMPYVIFKVGDQCFGFSAEVVREMFILQSVTPVPNTPDYIRGLINLRGKIVNLIDLREFIGLPSYTEEISKQLESVSSCLNVIDGWVETWAQEGKASHERFSVTEMGQWVASLSSEHSQLKKHLAKLPKLGEKMYHDILEDRMPTEDGAHASSDLGRGAQESVESFKKQLSLIADILRGLDTEMVIVFELDSALGAITVDEVLAVELISHEAVEAENPTDVFKQARLDGRIARREKTEDIVVLTSPRAIQLEN